MDSDGAFICFLGIPSYTVRVNEQVKRTGRIGYDFNKRIEQYPYMEEKYCTNALRDDGRVPCSGSCQYPDDPEFYAFAAEPECLPKIWDSGEAGSLHHFLSLVVTRGDPYPRK